VEPRYEADLTAVAENPLVDVNALAKPLFIMTDGRITLNKVSPNP
jgi:imidazolonepropionase-like amidohydrolase